MRSGVETKGGGVQAIAEDLAVDRTGGPAGREGSGVRLIEKVGGKEIGVRVDVSRNEVRLEGAGAESGGGGDRQRAGVGRARGEGSAAVECVADVGSRRGGGDGHLQRCGIDAALDAEDRVFDEAGKGGSVAETGRRSKHEAGIARRAAAIGNARVLGGEDEFGDNRAAGVSQGQGFTGACELEVRVQCRGSSVLAGGKDNEESPGTDGGRRKRPRGGAGGELIAGDGNRLALWIVEFDPVG